MVSHDSATMNLEGADARIRSAPEKSLEHHAGQGFTPVAAATAKTAEEDQVPTCAVLLLCCYRVLLSMYCLLTFLYVAIWWLIWCVLGGRT